VPLYANLGNFLSIGFCFLTAKRKLHLLYHQLYCSTTHESLQGRSSCIIAGISHVWKRAQFCLRLALCNGLTFPPIFIKGGGSAYVIATFCIFFIIKGCRVVAFPPDINIWWGKFKTIHNVSVYRFARLVFSSRHHFMEFCTQEEHKSLSVTHQSISICLIILSIALHLMTFGVKLRPPVPDAGVASADGVPVVLVVVV